VSADTSGFPGDLLAFVESERWTYAKTMPTWPHEYLVRERVNAELFVRLVLHIRAYGYDGHFYQKDIRYYDEDGWVYWTMGAPVDETTIINRCRTEQSFEYRSARGDVASGHSVLPLP
jgi:hypothetical protein